MSLLHEIHNQPRHIRMIMWACSSFAAIAIIGYFWLGAFQQELFVAIHPTDTAAQQQFAATQNANSINIIGAIGTQFGNLAASIGNLVGIKSSKGIDTQSQQGSVHLLPLSH